MIHNSSFIEKNAIIGKNVKVGPFCYIGEGVVIEENCNLKSHVSILGNTTIGSNNIFYPFCSIGTPPQDLKYKGEKNFLVIGNNNKFREYVNINPGTEQGGTITKVSRIELAPK